jgi:hypothetical protein
VPRAICMEKLNNNTSPPLKGGFFMFWKTAYIYLRIYHEPYVISTKK